MPPSFTAADAASTRSLAERTLAENRVAVFIVCYNAEAQIARVLARIPDWVATRLTEVFVIDDCSGDATLDRATQVSWGEGRAPFRVFRTPYFQGYGGNQRLGYRYAIDRGFDIVVLLHGDGQYAPESLPEILAAYSRPERPDAVYGSRFLNPGGARRGRMPLHKFVGNRLLTWFQNRALGTHLSEMHSGYRSYRTAALRRVPFEANSLGFDFDADIIVQFVAAGLRIHEVAIPTFYGDELRRVKGLRYAAACVRTVLRYRAMQLELFHDPKFAIPTTARKYLIKKSPTTVHHFARSAPVAAGTSVLDLGGGDGSAVGVHHARRGARVICVDQYTAIPDAAGQASAAEPNLRCVAADLDGDWRARLDGRRFETVFVLDVLEHLKSPEHAAREIFQAMKPGGKLYASTGNVVFWVIRFMQLCGQFNYGRRGILDLTHTRLFTVASFRRLLRNAGFQLETVEGFGPPIADLAANPGGWLRCADRLCFWFARLWKRLFAYQILIVATRPPAIEDLCGETFRADWREAPGSAVGTATTPVRG